MRGPIPIYIPLGTQFKETSNEASMCASSKEVSWEVSYMGADYELIEN